MSIEKSVAVFRDLGFTELESEIFVYLVQHSPATGYRIAKAIKRSNANTYKAIESLEAKGAILVESARNRLCRAVPVDELLTQLERRFHDRRKTAADLLKNLKAAPEDERIYYLATPDQVYERARRILEECEQTVMLELFPEPLEALRSPIEETAGRGIRVSTRIYESAAIEGVNVIVSPTGAESLRTFPLQLLSLFADGSQFLIALIEPGGQALHQAIWSASPFMSWSYYTFVFSDFMLSSTLEAIESATNLDEVRSAVAKWKTYYGYPEGDVVGFHRFFEYLSLKYGMKRKGGP